MLLRALCLALLAVGGRAIAARRFGTLLSA
jgi:hypothetical protein